MNAPARVGVLGGTFDPIHAGHLAAARAAERALSLGSIVFVPSSQPPHRPDKPRASGYHRLQMTMLAVAGIEGWRVSDLELARPGESYTYDTLTALRKSDGGMSQLFFILGADAFAEIATWSRYPAVLELAHFAVIARPGVTLDSLRSRLPSLASRMKGPDVGPVALPAIMLIQAQTPDVSSTEIRRRASGGESLNGLVPESVEQYINAHQLYRRAPGPEPRAPGPSGKPLA